MMTRHCHTLVVLVGFTTSIGCGSKEETQTTKSQEPTAVVITTAPMQLRSIQRSVSVVGTLAGYEEVVISPKVDGRVIGIFADIGDTVIPGAILLELAELRCSRLCERNYPLLGMLGIDVSC